MAIKILVMDDDRCMVSVVTDCLRNAGFDVQGTTSTQEAGDLLREYKPDILILDDQMPEICGKDFVKSLRSTADLSQIPVIMMTGNSCEEEKLKSFECGVDDHIIKPFSLKELVARIRAICRRTGAGRPSRTGLFLDLKSHSFLLNGQPLGLTLTEFNLLRELFEHPEEVYTRDQLRTRALGGHFIADRTIDVHMTGLRKKLGSYGERIQTVRGVGFKMVPQ